MARKPKRRGLSLAVYLDDLDDPRFAAVAEVAGYSVDEAWGRFLRMWAYCLKRQEFVLHEAIVRRFLGPAGVDALLLGGVEELALGTREGDGVYIRGTREALSWLGDRRSAASAGGGARAGAARLADGTFVTEPTITPAKIQPESSQSPATNQPVASRNPAPSLSLSLSLSGSGSEAVKIQNTHTDQGDVCVSVASPVSGTGGAVLRRAETPRAWAGFVVAFTERYGAAPTFTEEAISRVRVLVEQHGADEFIKRARRMLLAQPAWLKGKVDATTLSHVFDKLVDERLPPRARGEKPFMASDEDRRAASAIADEWNKRGGVT